MCLPPHVIACHLHAVSFASVTRISPGQIRFALTCQDLDLGMGGLRRSDVVHMLVPFERLVIIAYALIPASRRLLLFCFSPLPYPSFF